MPDSLALMAAFREAEEKLLRDIVAMRDSVEDARFNQRWLSIARTSLEQGFMALNRAVIDAKAD